jgi:Putative zinc-finger
MSCPFEEKLTSWLLGDLSPQEQDEVTCHIFECAACRKECDELRKILFPLRSALHKDQGLFKVRANVPWWQRVQIPAWVGRAALLMLSASIVLAVMSVYHQELTKRNSREEGPVTHITFGKIQPPPAPLEKLVVKTTREEDLLADLKLGIIEDLGLEQYALVLPPPIPGAQWTPTFITLNQLTMLCRLEENKESVHERLMRELPDARWNTDVGPVRNLKKPRRTSSCISDDIYYAAPVYKPATNAVKESSKKP